MTQVLLFNCPNRHWLHFARPLHVVATRSIDGVVKSLRLIEELVNRERLFAAGFISYEAASAFDRALTTHPLTDFPLLWFGLFRKPQIVPEPTAVAEPTYRLGEWQPTVNRNEYRERFDAIKRAIAR
ncbi:MAG: aminodeoxychorismate synthase, component I, partial [candidate division Zixibacteria bacterium]|nr:aminodeoxychorismate synthase, component I [candidate division Zixibacteria bacterium]